MKICRKIILLLLFAGIFGGQAIADEHLISQLRAELNLASDGQPLPQKCGLPVLVEAYRKDAEKAAALVSRYRLAKSSQTQDTYISPSGHFEISYNPAEIPAYDRDSNGTPDYLEFVAKGFDRAWFVEIDSLGFLPPPDQNGQPLSVYPVTCTNLGSNLYGVTYFDEDIPALPGFNYTSEIELNTYFGFVDYPAANGDPIVRDSMAIAVTAAHEFNHALQLGYRFWYENNQPTISNLRDLRLIEGSATYMEEVVADEVNDYYLYLPSFFRRVNGTNWDDDNGSLLYGDVAFYIMLGQLYGKQITREIWEEMRNLPSLLSMGNVLFRKGSNLPEELRRLATWMYFSGDNAISGEFFEEGDEYPGATLVELPTVEPDQTEKIAASDDLPPLSFQLLQIPVFSTIDTVKTLLSPDDAQSEWLGASLIQTAPYVQNFGENEFVNVPLNSPETDVVLAVVSGNWSDDKTDLASYRIRMRASAQQATTEILAYPNIVKPDVPVTQINFINLPEESVVMIFNSNGIRVAEAVVSESGRSATWNLRNLEGNPVGSGVYIYRVQSDSKSDSGKLIIVR
ncbi:MAG: T9SS type A sorting domain-containing protein [Calditrichia bacterium]